MFLIFDWKSTKLPWLKFIWILWFRHFYFSNSVESHSLSVAPMARFLSFGEWSLRLSSSPSQIQLIISLLKSLTFRTSGYFYYFLYIITFICPYRHSVHPLPFLWCHSRFSTKFYTSLKMRSFTDSSDFLSLHHFFLLSQRKGDYCSIFRPRVCKIPEKNR